MPVIEPKPFDLSRQRIPYGAIRRSMLSTGTQPESRSLGKGFVMETIYGDGSAGDGVITGTTTLTADTFYESLLVQSGGVLETAGYRVFVRSRRGAIVFGTIQNNGVAGSSAGSSQTGGAAGAAGGAGTLAGASPSGAGGNGGGITGDGAAGSDVGAVASCVGTANGSDGGKGGTTGSNNGGAKGIGGTRTAVAVGPRAAYAAFYMHDKGGVQFKPTPGAGGGGGSGGTGTDTGAGGGGGGGGGGFVWIATRLLRIGIGGVIQANGGAGGNGGSVGGGNRGGGGGGGGNGGVIILIYNKILNEGTVQAAFGAGGAKGQHTGTQPDDGVAGSAGLIIEIQQ